MRKSLDETFCCAFLGVDSLDETVSAARFVVDLVYRRVHRSGTDQARFGTNVSFYRRTRLRQFVIMHRRIVSSGRSLCTGLCIYIDAFSVNSTRSTSSTALSVFRLLS